MKDYVEKPLADTSVPEPIVKLISKDLTNYLIIKDGHIVASDLSASFDAIFVGTYGDALPDKLNVFFDSEFVNEHPDHDEAYHYNLDHVNSGLLIHVPRNVAIAERLHVFYLQSEHELVQNVRIVLEPGSEFKYFEYFHNETAADINIVSNSVVRENAKLSYTGISAFNKDARVDVRRNSFVFRYGRSEYDLAEVNDGNIVAKTNIFLQEKYAAGTSKTVAISSEQQEVSFRQMIEHNAPETEGYIENYGVSNHASHLYFEGVGKINKNMKRSVARQSNRGIVLGKDARLDANPLLLIDEYDVEAGHGAAIGKIDEEQLYYLMSRGLSLRAAERLIISGFLSPVMSMLSTDTLRDDFMHKVEAKTS